MNSTRLIQDPRQALAVEACQAKRRPHGVTLSLQWRLAALEFVIALSVTAAAWAFAPPPALSFVWVPVIAGLVVTAIQAMGGYGLDRLIRPSRAIDSHLAGLTVLSAGMWWLQWGFSAPPWLAVAGLVSLCAGSALALLSVRWLYASWIGRAAAAGRIQRHIGVVRCGEGGVADAEIDARMRSEVSLPPQIRQFSLAAGNAPMPDGHDAVRLADSLCHQLSRAELDEVLLVVPAARRVEDVASDRALNELIKALEMLPHRTRLILPDGKGGLRFARLLSPALNHEGLLLKRGLDLSVALAMLLILAPVMLLVAAAIKIESKGPVFFKQKRFGYRNTIFELWKFRSMYTEMCDANAAKLTTRDDPRVTRVGAFIRRTSIDELPQLINVLKGDMSLVGPRPHPLSAKAGERLYEDVIERFARRYRVKPGLTGLAQVTGLRGNTDTEDKLVRRFEADLDYVRHWSIWRDLWILIRTPWASIAGENAF